MNDYQLSILIPSLKEEFLKETVEDILKNKRGKTEVIVGLDGEWTAPALEDHPDLRIVYSSKNLGQRGMTNLLCRLSGAKYVAKTDAHCAFDEGFDVKLMEAMAGHDNWTVFPVMRNLHVFNWHCLDCGDESYQGPEPEGCKNCNVNTPDRFEKKIVWFAKPSPNSSAFKFTPNRLQFKYFGTLKNKQQGQLAAESMSVQGSFFMLTREKYWALNICDESWGGWGQQGTEVALKTWLSGGEVRCVMNSWYAHMFRTQSGFAFPWGNPGRQQHKARQVCLDLFKNNKWDKQVRPLSWVIERFWDELQQEPHKDDDPKWTTKDLDEIKATEGRFNSTPSKGIIYYTTNRLRVKIAKRVQKQIKSIGLPIVSASLKPMDMGTNIVLRESPGTITMFKQIIAALEASKADIIYFCEHDVLYHPSHFDFVPEKKDKFYYNQNWTSLHKDGVTSAWDANRVMGLCAYRNHLLDYYRNRLQEIETSGFNRSYEPGGRDENRYEVWRSTRTNVDIRDVGNVTGNKRSLNDFRNKSTAVNFRVSTIDKIEGWDLKLEDIYK